MIIELSSPTSLVNSAASVAQENWGEIHFAIEPDLEDSLDLQDTASSAVSSRLFSRLDSDSSMTS